MTWARLLSVLAVALAVAVHGPGQASGQASGIVEAEAVEYLRSLPSDTKIYIWPTQIVRYEVLGELPGHLVADYADRREGIGATLVKSNDRVDIAVLGYRSSRVMPEIDDLLSSSRLPASFKLYLRGLALFEDPCAFDVLTSRDTWAVGGIVAVDLSRLDDELVKICVDSGLDYIGGLPTPPVADASKFPSEPARDLILSAVTACAVEGIGRTQQRTRANRTPLPSITCVREKMTK